MLKLPSTAVQEHTDRALWFAKLSIVHTGLWVPARAAIFRRVPACNEH